MEHKYKLDKRRNRVKYCPCNKKNNDNKFVPFIDFENKGYCFSCLKTFFPKNDNDDFKKQTEYKYEPPKPISYHEHNLVAKSGRNFKHNNFIQFVKSTFGEEETKKIILKYLIGTSKKWKGACVFWQIDNNENVRHGKIMLYNSVTGKRRYKNEKKKENPYVFSVSKELKLNDFKREQCLFGLHLINETESKSIAIVESEKTAILMSIFKPEYVWLATGGKSLFKYPYLKILRNYKIIAFPDKTEYSDWDNLANELNNLGFNITVSKWIENKNCKKGTDLADILIQEKLYNRFHIKNNQSQVLSNSLNLIKTSTEIIIEKLALKNPNILELIKTFELTDKNGTIINQQISNK